MIVKAKECALGDCSEVTKANRNLPLIYNDAGYISIGIEDQDQYAFNKQDLFLLGFLLYVGRLILLKSKHNLLLLL